MSKHVVFALTALIPLAAWACDDDGRKTSPPREGVFLTQAEMPRAPAATVTAQPVPLQRGLTDDEIFARNRDELAFKIDQRMADLEAEAARGRQALADAMGEERGALSLSLLESENRLRILRSDARALRYVDLQDWGAFQADVLQDLR